MGYENELINDSKKLTAKKREMLYDDIVKDALWYDVKIVSPKTIDELNILEATRSAMEELSNEYKVSKVLSDAVKLKNELNIPIIKGDAKSISIAAASIVAKVTRDRLMLEYDKQYPEYDFASNKGYGSAKHIDAIKKHGATPIHRTTFIKNFI